MSSESIDPAVESKLREQYEDVSRCQADLLESAKQIAPLVNDLDRLQRHHNQMIAAMEEAIARLHATLDTLPDSQLRSIIAPQTMLIGVQPTEQELVGWIYRQVRANPRSERDLVTAYERRYALDPTDLVSFLSGSKFFRKIGQGDDTAWMVSANREDDLREYLDE